MDFACRVQAVEHGHADVHNGDIGLGFLNQPDRLLAVVGFADHLHSFPFEKGLQALAYQHMIVR